MGLIERIKSVLGFGTSATPSQPATGRNRPSTDEAGSEADSADESDDDEADGDGSTVTAGDAGDGVDVTVEHDPDTETETETETEAAVKGVETDAGADADLEEIKGIGPTYADRLREAGVESVADLAAADATDLAEASDIGESRVRKWIDRAET